MDIKQLQKEGLSARAIARQTGYSRNTVKKVLEGRQARQLVRSGRTSCLDDFKPYVKERHSKFDLSAIRLIEEIRPMGYTGSIRTLRRYLQELESACKSAAVATVRFETGPGQQGQADWAHCGHFVDRAGNCIPLYVFVLLLGFSRTLFLCFTSSMELPVLMRCHQEAFEFFGGMPQFILYDNMAQIRLPHSKILHPRFVDFAVHYGFTVKTHRVRRPRTKGKVERMVDYVKDNFLNGRAFVDLAHVNAEGLNWLQTVANVRIHGTTDKRPIDLLAAEGLTPFSSVVPYVIHECAERKVSVDGFVSFDRSRYSVDPDYVGRMVRVEAFEGQIVIRSSDLIITEHDRSSKPGSCIAKKEHLERMWKVSTGNPGAAGVPHWEQVWQGSVAVTDLCVYESAISPCAASVEVAA